MKRIVLMALIALALPVGAFAGSVDFGNSGGTLAGSSAGLSLSGSVLNLVGGLGNGLCSIALPCGSVSFTTGALTSGNVSTGAVFGPGGTFVIMSNGNGGLPPGVIFSGTFTSNTTWTPNGTVGVDGSIFYGLFGKVSGTWFNGATVSGSTFQMTVNAGKDGFTGSVGVASGDTFITTTPEPGTLGLLGTGLVGLAGIVRKKLKA
ncbi:MAG: PEP-CTERM sorting domain-containing protein [Candidatus Sulfotelmatobacter sp.]